MQLTLADFIRTGQLGPLGIGSPTPVVRQVLGMPLDQARLYPGQMHSIFKWGALEVTFEAGRVVLISFEFKEPLEFEEPLDITDFDLFDALTIDEASAFFARLGCSMRPYPPLTWVGAQATFRVGEAGVMAGFDLDPVWGWGGKLFTLFRGMCRGDA